MPYGTPIIGRPHDRRAATRRGMAWVGPAPGWPYPGVRVRLPFDSGQWYSVFGNSGAGDPIAYDGSPLDQTTAVSWTSPALSPGTWKFGVRAQNASGPELNRDCVVTIAIDDSGADVTNLPAPPVGLRAFAVGSGAIRAEWTYPTGLGAQQATSFSAYVGVGTPDYATPAATVAYSSGINNAFVANIGSLSAGTTYAVVVRASNATGQESNTNSVSATTASSGPSAVQSLSSRTI